MSESGTIYQNNAPVDQHTWAQLPSEVRADILNGRGSDFLEALATASFDRKRADRFLDLFHQIAADTAARWLRRAENGDFADEVTCISCLARTLPFATYLRPLISELLAKSRVLRALQTQSSDTNIISKDDIRELLLSLFRLLSYDLEAFSEHIETRFLSSLLSHECHDIRFLAVECLSQVMRFADALNQSLIIKHVGCGSIIASWEDTTIDYRLLKLYEEKRWKACQQQISNNGLNQVRVDVRKRFAVADIDDRVVAIGDALLPFYGQAKLQNSAFVRFPTSTNNLNIVGLRMQKEKPILVVGPSGSGKTALIREAAYQSSKLSSMISLHLNDQTDAKTLVGIYTSSTSGAGFTWQPGILTKAVQEGRWVLIEDIDRAPAEVMGLLRPLIENNKLFLPSRKEKIRAKDGFRLLATTRSAHFAMSSSSSRHASLSNSRLWSIAQIRGYSSDETTMLMNQLFPNLGLFLPSITSAHEKVLNVYASNPAFRSLQSRIPTIRDLKKWCRRLSLRLSSLPSPSMLGMVPEGTMIDMLKDGLDCYAVHLNDAPQLDVIALTMAQSLNIAPTVAEYAYKRANPAAQEEKDSISIGRSSLPRVGPRKPQSASSTRFALTRQVRRNMETIASAAASQEPLLLVGETGVGKTTLLQYIASSIGQKLAVVNLSNQSEASDLLGGLKPVTTRSLIVPLIDDFNELFDQTFSANKNSKFQQSVARAFAKQRWQRLLTHWEEAVQLSLKSLPTSSTVSGSGESGAKRRKLDNTKYEGLRVRWNKFAARVAELKAQIARTESNQVFAFVESRLVQAVRDGDWLLLDEINLATSETLDNIVTLLTNRDEEPPHLLLAEAGNIERIEAHPNFRVFAAMNPATDTGKKDLPSAIRAHFTELFVQPGDGEVHDLVEIIQNYLGSALDNDKRAATDLAKAYLSLKQLNADRKLTDGAGDLPHFSLRSLTRCLQFVQLHGTNHGLRRSMCDGIQMSFFTVLDAKSQALALPVVEQHLIGSPQVKKMMQSQKPKATIDNSQFVIFEQYAIAKGHQAEASQPQYIITGSVRRNLMNLARAASMRRFPVLLQGPTSAGKTSMVEYLARYSRNKFVRINNHEHTDLQEYLGTYASGADGRLEYREGVLVEALRKGYWIVLDELNLAPSDVLEALNRLLDDNRELLIPETQEIVRPHQNFMLFATQNPAGVYGGRKRLSRAFRNRFLEIHVNDIPEDELETILKERAQIAPSYCKQIVEVYKKLSLQRQSSRLFEARNSFATLRDLFRWASRPVQDREQLAYQGFMLLAERVRDPAEKATVKNTIEQTLKVRIDIDRLYGSESIPKSLIGDGTVTWTRAMRRLFVLVSTALQNNEPVLLVGETGCGKTQVCQSVTGAFGKHLDIYNAHSNTETGDLIGSQRPIRHKSELAETIVQDLQNLGGPYEATRGASNIDVDELIFQFRAMDTSSFDELAVSKIRNSIATYQSLFVWGDGGLVRAMKEGNHFLLDEISLAEDSVLERLNSVLEPARTILLAEMGAVDNLVVAQPGFQFLATMNPGGDYGKRELSAALRNRLTEIWVAPLSDAEDVVPILNAQLQDIDHDVATRMITFAQFFQSEIQGSTSVTLPLRTLLSWARFVKQNEPLIGLQRAVVHGAAMTYIDSIGANPAGLVSSAGNDLQHARDLCLKKLTAMFNLDAAAVYYILPALILRPDKLQIGDFALPRFLAARSEEDLVLETPTTRRNAMRILRAVKTGRSVLLEGNPGVGKTAIVSSLARLCGKSLSRMNLSDQTDLMDLFGADAPAEGARIGSFVWRDGPLLQAMQTGGWVLLDEMNLASQSVLEGLNACLDHRQEVYIAELDMTFKCHPDFVLFATQNPHHQGGGRKGLPASFVNRFSVVYADPFSPDDLHYICKLKYPSLPGAQIEKAVAVVDECQKLTMSRHDFSEGGPWELNLRDLNRWLSLCALEENPSPNHHFSTIIASRFRSKDAKQAAQDFSNLIFGASVEQSLFNNLTSCELQIGTAFLHRDQARRPVTTVDRIRTTRLPAAKAIMTALAQNWPIILVGPASCGKTSMIRSLAALSGAKLVEFSMNADIDTADLVGGYEQFDSQRVLGSIKSELEETVGYLCAQCFQDASQPSIPILQALLDAHDRLQHVDCDVLHTIEHLQKIIEPNSADSEDLRALLRKAQGLQFLNPADSTRFVWNDGILIDALQSGSWLVLDNANLCNPSVLDRLNSLLEPNGELIINEQHGTDGHARTIRPHPNFRVILTADPKFGELSRAMRNRSLEIYFDIEYTEDTHSKIMLPQYPAESKIARLRGLPIERISSKNTVELAPYINRLSYGDLAMLTEQKSVPELHLARYEADLRLDVTLRSLHDQLRDLGARVPSLSSKSDTDLYPALLTINEPILHLDDSLGKTTFVERATKYYLMGCFALQYVRYVEQIGQGQFDKDSNSILVRSSPQYPKLRHNQNPLFPAFSVLQKLSSCVSIIMQACVQDLESEEVYEVFNSVAWLFADLVSLLDETTLDQTRLQAYAKICEDLMLEVEEVFPQVRGAFGGFLKEFGVSRQLTTGQGLQKMWPLWKGKTAASKMQLEARLAMETVIHSFDELSRHLPHPRAQLADVRQRLLEALGAVPHRLDAPRQIEILSKAIENLATQKMIDFKYSGHFGNIFDRILEKARLCGISVTQAEIQQLVLFGTIQKSQIDQPNEDEQSPMSLLRRFSLASAIQDEATHVQTLPPAEVELQRLAALLNSVCEQPIGTINYAVEEFETLVKVVSRQCQYFYSDNIRPIRIGATQLLWHLLSSDVLLTAGLLPEKISPEESVIVTLRNFLTEAATEVHQKGPHFVLEHIQALLGAIEYLESSIPSSVGKGLFVVATICMRLLIPDKPFDPAAYPLLVFERHERQTEKLRSAIKSWTNFQQDTTGQKTNLIIRTLQDDLTELGPPPNYPKVYRPNPKSIHGVQSEFWNILRSIVTVPIENSVLHGDWHDVMSSSPGFWKRIRASLDRLSTLDHAYDDLTEPIAGLLHCVALGLKLALHGVDQDTEDQNRTYATTNARFAKSRASQKRPELEKRFSRLDQVLDGQIFGEIHLLSIAGTWTCLRRLKVDYTAAAFGKLASHSSLEFIVKAIDRLYMMWKLKLDADQREAEKQSRYYSYRGEEDSSEPSEADVRQLFPTYDTEGNEQSGSHHADEGESGTHDSDTDVDIATFDTRKHAIELAKFHRSLMSPTDLEGQIRLLLRDRVKPKDDFHLGQNPDEALSPEAIPGLMLSMQSQELKLEGRGFEQSLNIYADSSIIETRKLFEIVVQAQSRFAEIAAAWPDHSVPREVLDFCSQVLSLKMSDPIVKLLTKTEKLIEIVAQWQKVASREWSVSNIVESLTSLIISWRRLELGSWSKLLDIEDSKQGEDADEWYFVAYESVVYNPRMYIHRAAAGEPEEELELYRSKLAKTLEEFLRNTTLGQFSHRLHLLGAFVATLRNIAQNMFHRTRQMTVNLSDLTAEKSSKSNGHGGTIPAEVHGRRDPPFLDDEQVSEATSNHGDQKIKLLSVANFDDELNYVMSESNRAKHILKVCDTVANIVQHYHRYEEHISKLLQDGRQALERSITEQIKLASWRDTNITALRDSARASHFKLFKVVKKYRALLRQPVPSFVASYADGESQVTAYETKVAKVKVFGEKERSALCAARFQDWHLRPERQRNPFGASNAMRLVYDSAFPDFGIVSELAEYVKSLSASVQELRKTTPTILTDDNTGLVRDLKQRKRRLLAETMKILSQMGIRRNLGTNELQNQATTATILAKIPALSSNSVNSVAFMADKAFHELVDILPTAREAAIEHSEELTDGEVRRGLGYLEGLMFLTLKQRTLASSLQRGISRLREMSVVLTTVQATPGAEWIRIDPKHEIQLDRFFERAAMLPHLINVYTGIVQYQAEKGGLDCSKFVSRLQQHGSAIAALNEESSIVKGTLKKIQTKATNTTYKTILAILSQLKEDLQKWSVEHPQFEYAAQALQAWLRYEQSAADFIDDCASLDATYVDKKAQGIVNKIFVALQTGAGAIKSLPTSPEDQSWLAKSTEVYAKTVFALHIDQTCQEIEALLDTLTKTGGADFQTGLAIVALAAPVFQQFQFIIEDVEARLLQLHHQTSRLAVFLGRTFTKLVMEGFCSPAQTSTDQEQVGKMEEGTGLGEGEAAEDISKDVGDDEDLTELAQEDGKVEEGSESIEKSKDAIDMGANELEGEMGSGDEEMSGDEGGGESEEEQEMNEETGSVDDLDPSAVDEKMWNDMQKEADKEEKELKGQKAQGQGSDEQAAEEDALQDEDSKANEEASDAAESSEEIEAQQKAEGENIDPHLQEEQALEVPDDMQLNGEEEKEHAISDTDMDDLSDVADDRQTQDKQDAELPDETQLDEGVNAEKDVSAEEDQDETDIMAQDDEIIEEPFPSDSEEQEKGYHNRDDDAVGDIQDQETGDAGKTDNASAAVEEQYDENQPHGRNEASTAALESQEPQESQAKPTAEQESSGTRSGAMEHGIGQQEEMKTRQDEALKKLADVLQQYHQRREIFTADEERQQGEADQDVDMASADFEHVRDELDEGQAQALGTAEQDTVQNFNDAHAIENSKADVQEDLPMPDQAIQEAAQIQPETLTQKMTRMQHEQLEEQQMESRNAVAPDTMGQQIQKDHDHDQDAMSIQEDLDMVETEEHLPPDKAEATASSQSMAHADAQQLWSLTSTKTRSLSLMLTEQLRLILQPTTATKLRGDFRTGKRLNIRRIIPYIASGYKRDKIWMRRSVPSKRNYQVMLAVDDSRSMAESGADVLALETLCMLSCSLTMLEVGDLSIVAFGKDYNPPNSGRAPQAVKVAHPFSAPFSPSTSGPETFAKFSFDQTGTDIKALLSKSIQLFKDSRIQSSAREAVDLWQLQIIISDGHIGSDSDDSVRRLVRRAREEKIMPVFVIVDNGAESIVDLREVVFEKDDKDERGEMKVKTKRYLEGFPFQYYVVVREVRDLPAVLARVLKGWFEGVVETG